jgi:hypothetical protein
MNRYAFLATALAMALYAAPVASPARAAGVGTIQRCQAADGTVSYTDKSCAVFDQRTVAVSAIVVDDGPEATLKSASQAGMDVGTRRAVAVGRRSPASGCARTPTQLQMDLRGAFALGDVNRVAESYHWVGMSSDGARTTMDRLQRLAENPVIDTRYYDASISSGGQLVASAGGGAGGGMLQLVLGGDGRASVVDFDVHRYAGCYFVSF